MKVLCIDDSLMMQKIVGIYLAENDGFKFVSASSGRDGIEKARNESPDVILLDIEMPDMAGEEALKALKSSALTRSIPVIMFTPERDQKSEARYIGLGASGYVKKPHGVSRLKEMIKALLAEESEARAQ